MNTPPLNQPSLRLNDATYIPQLGFGVFKVADEMTAVVVEQAIDAGYRLIDTAAIYRNEDGVGQGIRAVSVPREELHITTKLWNSSQGYDAALKAMDQSLSKLQLDYVDLYLIHWPAPRQNRYVESWQALAYMKEQGLAKSIGVSNFTVANLQRLYDETGIVPSLNQIELHPLFQQKELREYHRVHGIATESWGPLAQGDIPRGTVIDELADKYGKTPAQVILRWHLDCGLIAIPKSSSVSRIQENFDVFDFKLSVNDLERIALLDRGPAGRIGPDPDTADF